MKVSIITATYNSATTLPTALQSVYEQDYADIEHILIDGGSTDTTVAIIKEMSLKNSNIRYVSEPDEGIYDAINKGLAMATGDIIGFVHSDDFLAEPTTIANIVALFKKEDFTGVYGDLWYVDRNDTDKVIRHWKSNAFHNKLLQRGWMPAHPTFFLKREVYTECGNFNTSYKIAADYDFMLRVLRKSNYTFGYLPKVITKMRMGGESNKRIANIILKSKEDLRAMKANNLTSPLLVLWKKNVSKLKQFV